MKFLSLKNPRCALFAHFLTELKQAEKNLGRSKTQA